MDPSTLLHDAMLMVVALSAPGLLVTTALGIAISLVQGLFQIQDQALAYTAKLVALVAILLLTGRWMETQVVALADQMFTALGQVR